MITVPIGIGGLYERENFQILVETNKSLGYGYKRGLLYYYQLRYKEKVI